MSIHATYSYFEGGNKKNTIEAILTKIVAMPKMPFQGRISRNKNYFNSGANNADQNERRLIEKFLSYVRYRTLLHKKYRTLVRSIEN